MGNDPAVGSTPLGLSEAEPLLNALHDPSPDTRLAVLGAMTRVPLEPACWMQAREYVTAALEDPTMPEHLDAIAVAARVPVQSVRLELYGLAETGEPEERRRAVQALAEVGDEHAVRPLVDLLENAADVTEAARLLARFDVSTFADAVRGRWGSLTGEGSEEPRFWLALALARSGDDAELLAFLGELESGESELPILWGDPSVVVAELRRGAELPEAAQARLRTRAERATGQARTLSELLLEADQRGPAAEAVATAAAKPVTSTTAERRLVVKALDGLDLFDERGIPKPDWQQDVMAAIDELGAKTDHRTAGGVVVSELFRHTLESDAPLNVVMGNDVAQLAHDLPDYAPDLDGLLRAYRVAEDRGRTADLGAQIGWAASRVSTEELVKHLVPSLGTPAERGAAARLIVEAADYGASAYPPIFGGAPSPPVPPAPVELIDDVQTANGGEHAEPPAPEPTAAEPPQPTIATVDEAAGEAEPREADEAAPESRWLLAWVTDLQRNRRARNAFRAGAAHEIEVAIGPEQEGALAARGEKPLDEELGPVSDMEPLVVKFVPAHDPAGAQQSTIFLPRTGTSSSCKFGVRVPGDLAALEAEITVHHRNRAIQMAKLTGPVYADPDRAPAGSAISFEVVAIRPGTADLDTREDFDVAVTRTAAATTGVAGEELIPFDTGRLERVVPTLADELTRIVTGDAARRGDMEDPDVVAGLRALAFQGCELHELIARPMGDHKLERLQLLTETATDWFPVEFVYELPPPKLGAGLCTGWKTALATGRCPEPHEADARGQAEHVCPSGFWAVSRVIERHVIGDTSWKKLNVGDADFAVRAYPTALGDRLPAPDVALFAASNRVDEVRKGGIAAVKRTLERIAPGTLQAETWDEWVDDVRRREPSLLVLLSHTTRVDAQSALEIGDGNACVLAQLLRPFLSASEKKPIVLLLGCETALADFELRSFVAKFQDLGAAFVVGTVGSVLGQRVVPVAQAVARELATASRRRKPTPGGDLLLRVRRKLLAKGELTALCLTAFGDTDWQAGG